MRISDWSSDVCSSDRDAATSAGSRTSRNSTSGRPTRALASSGAMRGTAASAAASISLTVFIGGLLGGGRDSLAPGRRTGKQAARRGRRPPPRGSGRPQAPLGQDAVDRQRLHHRRVRSEEHTSELQSLKRISYAVFCLKKKNKNTT